MSITFSLVLSCINENPKWIARENKSTSDNRKWCYVCIILIACMIKTSYNMNVLMCTQQAFQNSISFLQADNFVLKSNYGCSLEKLRVNAYIYSFYYKPQYITGIVIKRLFMP